MRKLWLAAGIFSVLTGCATPFGTQSVIKAGNYSRAYSMVINEPEWKKDKQQVIQSILEATGGAKSDLYLKNVQSYIKYNLTKNIIFYSETLDNIDSAITDGLLTQLQAKELKEELKIDFEEASINQQELLKSENLLTSFGLSRDKSEIAQRTLDRLVNSQEIELKRYLDVYQVLKSNGNSKQVKNALDITREAANKKLISLKQNRQNYSSLEIFEKYISVTGDHNLDPQIKDLIDASDITRENIKIYSKVFPDYFEKQIEKRVIKLDLKTNGDEFLLEEIAADLIAINDWVEIDPDASRKINFIRLRLNERRDPSINNTEIVSDPNFGTILIIPKNASVLIDYSISEYSLQWNFNIQEEKTKKSRNFTGSKAAKKIECRNIRYQNVFGGVGALNNFPNNRVQNFCQENSNVNFDDMRSQVIKEIAQDINQKFILEK